MAGDYYARNREAMKARAKARYDANKNDPAFMERLRLQQRARDAANPEKKAEYGKTSRARIKADPVRKAKRQVTDRVYQRARYRRNAGVENATAETRTGPCPICLSDGPLVCDHEHGPDGRGPIRGWICNQCNLGLGNLGDTRECIERALKYLTPAG